VHNDLDWLEDELSSNSSKGSSGAGEEEKRFIVGNNLTAADIIMGFSIEFILTRKLGTEGGSGWPRVHKWLDGIKEIPSYRKAVERTGYSL
jgi:glutathione S-transferase